MKSAFADFFNRFHEYREHVCVNTGFTPLPAKGGQYRLDHQFLVSVLRAQPRRPGRGDAADFRNRGESGIACYMGRQTQSDLGFRGSSHGGGPVADRKNTNPFQKSFFKQKEEMS
jgi:hypothetical protein